MLDPAQLRIGETSRIQEKAVSGKGATGEAALLEMARQVKPYKPSAANNTDHSCRWLTRPVALLPESPVKAKVSIHRDQ
jgi:hypothetical protein